MDKNLHLCVDSKVTSVARRNGSKWLPLGLKTTWLQLDKKLNCPYRYLFIFRTLVVVRY